MMDQQYYLEENKMLRELAQHWERMYNKADEERKSILNQLDKAVELITHLEMDYEKIKRSLTFDAIFWLYRYMVYYDKDNESPDPEDVVYGFSQWIQNEGKNPLKETLKTDEKGVEKAIDEILTGCTKWEEGNEQTN